MIAEWYLAMQISFALQVQNQVLVLPFTVLSSAFEGRTAPLGSKPPYVKPRTRSPLYVDLQGCTKALIPGMMLKTIRPLRTGHPAPSTGGLVTVHMQVLSGKTVQVTGSAVHESQAWAVARGSGTQEQYPYLLQTRRGFEPGLF